MSDSEAVVGFVDEYWWAFLEAHPLFATGVGIRRFDHLLPDFGDDGRARAAARSRYALAQADRFDRTALDFEARTALDMLQAVARREVEFHEQRLDRFWAVNHLFSGHWVSPSTLLQQIAALHSVSSEKDAERYLARLAAVPGYLAAVDGVIREAAATGATMPAVVIDRVLGQLDRMLETPIERSPVLEPLAGRANAVERAQRLLTTEVYPAFARYRDHVLAYRAHARERVGLCGLGDAGEAAYAAEVRGWTTLDTGPAELAALGGGELERIQAERARLARELGYGTPAEAIAAGDADLLETREAVMAFARDRLRRAADAIPPWFGRIPETRCDLQAVPKAVENDVLDYYEGPALDGNRPGTFFVNAKPRPRHSLACTTYHETIPGHHLQMSIDRTAAGRPDLRRFGGELQGTALMEGWGLYSERLAAEIGLYDDGLERLGMLDLQALRAARLVVDTGLHAFGWTRERAVSLLTETGLPAWKAEAEVDRYIAVPGQALCYAVGQLEVLHMRETAERAGGGSFSIARFHDWLLGLGSLPLAAARRELEATLSEPPREVLAGS